VRSAPTRPDAVFPRMKHEMHAPSCDLGERTDSQASVIGRLGFPNTKPCMSLEQWAVVAWRNTIPVVGNEQ
jgi:hypothetical protein